MCTLCELSNIYNNAHAKSGILRSKTVYLKTIDVHRNECLTVKIGRFR